MTSMTSIVEFVSGTPQFRITEDGSGSAPSYCFYSQADLEDDLRGMCSSKGDGKRVRTFDSVRTTSAGSVVFSLLSGIAAIVQPEHSGYLLTQNYVTLVPSDDIDSRYLVYLINENRHIRRQLRMGQQGSTILKYTLRQLNDLEVPRIPPIERQRLIGRLYADQIKLDALKKRASDLETALTLETIREVEQS